MVDRKTALKIAHWYYIENMTQQEIAKKMGYSRQRVNRIVRSLIEDGIVSIVINDIDSENVLLEHKLENAFSLERVVIADTDESGHFSLDELTRKAAHFLDDYIQDGKVVGVSWGNTLGETARHMRNTHKKNCLIVQLVGGLSAATQPIHPDEILRTFAQKLDCSYSVLYAPAILDSEAARQVLSQQEMYKETFGRMESCDIAVVGIGQMDDAATLIKQGYLESSCLETMIRQGYIGDVCFNHYKADGSLGNSSLNNRVMGVDMATLQKIPSVVAIAGGESKSLAVMGALRSGCINALVTDIALATKLEQMIETDTPESATCVDHYMI